MSTVQRVLMTADTVGGVWTYALELAEALAEQGVETALATMGAMLSRDQRCQAHAVAGLQVFESCFRLEWMENPWAEVKRAGDWLLDLEGRVEPDIVHLNSYVHGALPFRAPVLVAGHSCVLSWWRAVRGGEAPSEWDLYRRAVTRGLQSAAIVAAPTQAMLNELEQYYGPVRGGLVIPNGRAARRFRPAQKEEFVFSAGRLWDEAKNLTALDRAAKGMPWPVMVAGDTRHPDGGEARASNLRLLGKLSSGELAAWLGRAAVYCLPARYEPFGLSALEAALAGCALVLGDIESLREVWGDAALFTDPDHAVAIGGSVRRLAGDPGLRASLATRARNRALQLTPQRMAAGYLRAYQTLVSEHSAITALP